MAINYAARVPCSSLKDFFKNWFIFLKPYHNLTDREMDVIACLVRHRYELSKSISDEKILNDVTMSENTKREVREECGLTLPHFQVIMGKLRKNKVIVNNQIEPRYIPKVDKDFKSFNMALIFEIK